MSLGLRVKSKSEYVLESLERVPTVEEEEFFLEKTAAILEGIFEGVAQEIVKEVMLVMLRAR